MRRILYTALMLLSCTYFCYSQNNPLLQKSLDSVLIDAVQSYADGKYRDAKARLGVVTEGDRTNDAAFFYSGLSEYYLGNIDEAEVLLLKAVSLDPDNFWYRERLGAFYSMSGRIEKAIGIYETLLADFPKKYDIYYTLVSLYAGSNDLEKMAETIEAIETVAGKSESTTIARYEVLMHQDKADEAFNTLASYNEEFSSANILSMMGDLKFSNSQDSLAVVYYEEALTLEPDYPPALLGLSEVYRMNRKYDRFFDLVKSFMGSSKAVPVLKSQYMNSLVRHVDARFLKTYQSEFDSLYDTGVGLHSADSSILVGAGTYFFQTGRVEKAVELLKNNSDNYPGDFNANALYVESLNYSQRWEDLVPAAEEAYRRFPSEPAFISLVLAAYFNMEKYDEVVSTCNRMIADFPDDKNVALSSYSTIGDVYHLTERNKEAYHAYDTALKIDPDYVPVLNNYAYYLSIGGKSLKKAYAMSKKTIEAEPDNATYLDTFAWILHLMGKDLEAKSFFKHAMLYGGKESATILDHYATVLFDLKEYDLAKLYWDMAIKINNGPEAIEGLETRVKSKLESIK